MPWLRKIRKTLLHDASMLNRPTWSVAGAWNDTRQDNLDAISNNEHLFIALLRGQWQN